MNQRNIRRSTVAIAAAAVLGGLIFRVIAPNRATTPTGGPPVLAGQAGDIRLSLTVDPARPGHNRLTVKAAGPDRQPLSAESAVTMRVVRLDGDAPPSLFTLAPQGEGRFATEGAELAGGWSEIELTVRALGRPAASTAFPLLIGPPPSAPADAGVEQLFQDARAKVSELRSWREVEQLTDGAGGLVITHTDLLPPDRLHYVARNELPWTTETTEVVIIGADRYERRNAGGWKHELLRQPLVPEGYGVYMRSAEGIVGGRQALCADEPCRVVLWTQSGGSPAFAGWVGLRSHQMYRIYMRAPLHYITVWPVDLNLPVTIAPPPK